MHRLIERQLRKATINGVVDVNRLCELVSATYDETDAQRHLNANSLDALQLDLEIAAHKVRADAEARFNVLMDNVGEAVIVINEHGLIENFNNTAERVFGYGHNEMAGRPVDILMAARNDFRHQIVINAYKNTGAAKIIGAGREIQARRKSGEEFPAELAVGEVVNGSRRSFVGIIRDITTRKHIEQELRKSEARFRDLVGSASDWIWETDEDYQLTFVSERIAAVLGVKPSAILGNSFFDIGLGEGNRHLFTAHLNDIAERRSFRDVAFHVGPEMGKDARTIRISGMPLFSDDDTFIGYRGVGADITREAEAEKRAAIAQQHLADAIESIVDAISVFDNQDRLVVFNSQYAKAFSTPSCEIKTGMLFKDILNYRQQAQIFLSDDLSSNEWCELILEKHRQASGEPFLLRTKEGLWFLCREYRTRDGGTVGVRTEITEMKRREAELEALRHRYELILESAGEGIIGLNSKGRIIFANQTAGKMVGYSPEGMIGCCFHALIQLYGIDGEPYPYEESAVRGAYFGGFAAQVRDDIFWRFDGTPFHVEYQVTPIREGGHLSGAVLAFHDATLRLLYEKGLEDQQRQLEQLVSERTAELKREVDIRSQTEAALRISRERLKGIADSLFEGVLVTNRFGQLVFANASARRLLGGGIQGDLDGHFIDDLMRLRQNGQAISFNQSPWLQVIDDGITQRDDDATFVTAAGAHIAVAYACSPIRDEGILHAAIISFRDIENLKQAQRDALQASRLASVGQLAAGIAHEINTPVQYIGDNLRFIGTSLPKLASALEAAATHDGFQQEAAALKLPYLMRELPLAITESLDGVGQIARIVLSMKEFSHPGTSAKAATDINRAIENTLTVSRNTWKLVANMVKDLDPDLPPIMCYLGEMNQVFLNLIVNAAHAIESSGKPLPGTIRIHTARKGPWVEIGVTDSGSGVPASIMEKIFDPFFTTKPVGKGTGQGLAICRDVVMVKHAGQIHVCNCDDGEGAKFIVRLPIDDAEAPGDSP